MNKRGMTMTRIGMAHGYIEGGQGNIEVKTLHTKVFLKPYMTLVKILDKIGRAKGGQ